MVLRQLYKLLIIFVLNAAMAEDNNPLPINWSGLPSPFHTPSATNGPEVTAKPAGANLSLPPGFQAEEYMNGFGGIRFMLLGPEQEILASEIDTGRVYRIKDKQKRVVLKYLENPYGMALQQNWLYVAETRTVKRYKYDSVTGKIIGRGEIIIPMPRFDGGHITRTLLLAPDGNKLYLSVGSRSNVDTGEPTMRAAISRFNLDGSGQELVATGLRNTVGMRWYPRTETLWATTIERDGLGDDLVPDFLTKVEPGAFYGWPYAYIGPHEDPRNAGKDPELVKRTRYPNVLLGAHGSPLDMWFYTGAQFPEHYRGGCFIALHGSWNRAELAGYKIVFVPFKNGMPTAGPEDFMTGWMPDPKSTVIWGRPVGLLQLPDGSLLVSDDGAGKIWRVAYTGK